MDSKNIKLVLFDEDNQEAISECSFNSKNFDKKEARVMFESVCKAYGIFVERNAEYGTDTWRLPEFPSLAPTLNAVLAHVKIRRVLNIITNNLLMDNKSMEMALDNAIDTANYAHFLSITLEAYKEKIIKLEKRE